MHKCSGGLFAASNTKIMLACLVQNYEFDGADTGPDAFPVFIEYVTDPKVKLWL